MRLHLILLFLLISLLASAQKSYFPIDTLDKNDIRLEEINMRALNIYTFETNVESDSIFFVLPQGLPKGYYEVYYHNDSNQLALVYYNYGWSAYSQQFYANGAMKSDSEYNMHGQLHGLHVLYSRQGEEIWHADFYYGQLDKRYRLDYLEVENSTKLAIKTKKAFGRYEFVPTASRARRDRIDLNADSTFIYWDSQYDCHFCTKYKGIWVQQDEFLLLTLNDSGVWRTPSRKFAITATVRLTALELIEVKNWGVEWYNSEYKKVGK